VCIGVRALNEDFYGNAAEIDRWMDRHVMGAGIIAAAASDASVCSFFLFF
jgi:hypothetical protein